MQHKSPCKRLCNVLWQVRVISSCIESKDALAVKSALLKDHSDESWHAVLNLMAPQGPNVLYSSQNGVVLQHVEPTASAVH